MFVCLYIFLKYTDVLNIFQTFTNLFAYLEVRIMTDLLRIRGQDLIAINLIIISRLVLILQARPKKGEARSAFLVLEV